MCAMEPLHQTNPKHGKQGLGSATHHYGWEDVGCWPSDVQDWIVLYLRDMYTVDMCTVDMSVMSTPLMST